MRGITVAVLAAAAFGLTGCVDVLHAFTHAVRSARQGALERGPITRSSETRTLEGRDLASLRAFTEVGNVRVTAGGETASVTITKRSRRPNDLRVQLENRGGRLEVRAEVLPNTCTNCGVDLEFRVPAGLDLDLETALGSVVAIGPARSLTAKSDAGNVSAKGTGAASVTLGTALGNVSLEGAQGQIELSSDAGNVTVRDANGTVNAQTSLGFVEATGVRGSLELRSDAGNVTLRNARGTVTAQTSLGEVRLENVEFAPGSENRLFSDAGNVSASRVRFDGGAEISGTTDAGEVSVDLPGFSVDRSSDPNAFVAKRGAADTRLHLEASFGSVRVDGAR